MTSFDVQRANMVESQVRPSDVTDRRIIRAMLEVPRELFAPPHVRTMAYMDQELLVAPGTAGRRPRYLLAPRLLAKMIQHLELGDRDHVLEAACATGYDAAVLARIVPSVIALDSDPGLLQQAQAALAAVKAENVVVVAGDLPAGYPSEGPYDAILLAGSVPEVPAALLDQLKDGGRLVTVHTDTGIGRAMQWRRLGGTFDARPLFDATAPPLPGFERAPAFVF
jgi:protein-L-isoaspartate(D-aspartate) O-methyltransferase